MGLFGDVPRIPVANNSTGISQDPVLEASFDDEMASWGLSPLLFGDFIMS